MNTKNLNIKIAILTNSLDEKNGWGRYSTNLTRALTKSGIDCTVFTSSNERCPSDLSCHAILASRTGGWKNFFYVLYDYLRLRRRIHEFDLVHAFTETHIFLSYLLRKPYVLSTHGTFATKFFKNPILRPTYKKAFLCAGKIIITSNFTHSLIKQYVTLNNWKYFANGVNTKQFKILPGIKKDEQTFITVGAIKPRKGQDICIEALHLLKKDYPHVKLIIVGTPQNKTFFETIKNNIKKYGLEKNIIFTGKISDEELIKLYNSVSVYVQPSRVDKSGSFEGAPLTLLEASACGLPIIGTKASASADLIKNNYNGMLIDHDDAEALAFAIRKVLENPNIAREMGNNARVLAENLSWEHNAKNVIGIYNEILTR